MSHPALAATPEPPYYAVIFTSQRASTDPEGYARMAEAMAALAAEQPGYLGVEGARDTAGIGITVSYWRDEASIAAWKRVAAHTVAQRTGRDSWYEDYVVRVARIERAYTLASSAETGLR